MQIFSSEVVRTLAHIAVSLLLLLESGCLFSLCLVLRLRWLLLVLVGVVLLNKIIILLNKVGSRSDNSFSTCVFCSRLLFNIKSTNEPIDGELLSLVF
jgi:hypothetical protein